MNTQYRGPTDGASPPPGGYSEAPPASGIESMVIVPVHVRGLSFGALSFVTGAGRRGYRRSDLDTARGLAERVAIAVERVLLWRESRPAERAATRNAGQLRRLMEAALAVNAPLAESEVLRVVADNARRDPRRRAAVVAPVGGARRRHRAGGSVLAGRPGPGREGARGRGLRSGGLVHRRCGGRGATSPATPRCGRTAAQRLSPGAGRAHGVVGGARWSTPRGPRAGSSSYSAGPVVRSTPRTSRSWCFWPRWPRWPS